MGFPRKPGDTLLIPSGPSGLHLFIVLLGPFLLHECGAEPQLIMVSATTIRGLHDSASVLVKVDHPFIHDDSYILSRSPRQHAVSHVDHMVDSRIWIPREPCSSALTPRIVEGAFKSPLIPRIVKKILTEN